MSSSLKDSIYSQKVRIFKAKNKTVQQADKGNSTKNQQVIPIF